jgi:hypothetical protein
MKKLELEIYRTGNNLLYNKLYGMKKPFDKNRMFILTHYQDLVKCQGCGLLTDEVIEHINEFVNEH